MPLERISSKQTLATDWNVPPSVDSLRENLSQREKTLQLVDFFVRKAIEAEQQEVRSEAQENNGFIDFYRTHLEATAKMNVKSIYALAESPIELIFLNSLHLCFVKAAAFNVQFEESANDHLEFMESYAAYYRSIDQRFEEFRHRHEGATVAGFVRKAREIYADTEGHPMPPDVRVDLEGYLAFARTFFHNDYRLTLQASLPTIKQDGRGMRPDLFIWVPADPNFKIAVECDGYRYHSNPPAFTRDRQRDRILHSHGIDVLRFSGHEIHHDPIKTAGSLFERLEELAKERGIGVEYAT